eukprot:CAMPEP_0197439528 /NCGR_PEP_ID=MMETSP1175-20131217/6237_1 /TAXON_ID=1003142 /ORGANISM="Triceratium dubium, Strain CCMP147" /LENGTH=493 /DNA_ID=CAMNT_0042969455 /DNA_START=151 /DNA_END=1632 /DNA_ORIENTATION=-
MSEADPDRSVASSVDNNENEHSLPPPPPQTEPHQDSILVSLAGVAGNMLEWFDFACFGYFSDIIGNNFFPPNQGGHAALVQSFAVFGLAFLARPFGGALIGQMGDKAGRKLALETALLLMAFPTFAMGCLPTFSVAGYFATVLLILCRIAQGLSVGGQVMTSVVFTMERSPASRWGVWGSAVMSAATAGVTLGSLFSYILREALDDDQLNSWGWRIPFFFGLLGVVPGLYLKKHGKEHPIPEMEGTAVGLDEEQRGPPRRQESVIVEAFSRQNMRTLVAVTLVGALPAAAYYVVFIWLAIFMDTIVDPPVPHAFLINTIVGILGIIFMIFGGWLADCYRHYDRLMIMSGICLGVSCPFLLRAIGGGNPVVAFFCQSTLGLFLLVWNGGMLPWMVSSFPPSLRLTSVSIGYNISVCVFGGFAPTIATILVDNYDITSPGIFVSVIALLSIIGVLIAPKRQDTAPGAYAGSEIGLTGIENKVENGEGENPEGVMS